jgi:hypothetical protein
MSGGSRSYPHYLAPLPIIIIVLRLTLDSLLSGLRGASLVIGQILYPD